MAKPGVSIVACTNRPEFIPNILSNYKRQLYPNKELILIVNKDKADLKAIRRLASAHRHVRVYSVPERISLGQCLNCGISRSKHPLIAKLDHDDYYSPYYLREQVKTLVSKGSSVIGKHACLVYLEEGRQLVVRSPEEQHRFVDFIQGGTILFRRSVLKHARFDDISLGEDVRFLRKCRKRGCTVYASSPYNYVYIRRKNKSTHTWKVNDRYYLAKSLPIAVTDAYAAYAKKKA